VTETRYKAWGEVRYTTPNTTLPTRYTFTGQYSYVSDTATDLGSNGFGLMFYNARWYDSTTGRFAQADSIVPGGVQGLDRYAYVSNNPINFVDPSGHMCSDPDDKWSPSCDSGNNGGGVIGEGAPHPTGGMCSMITGVCYSTPPHKNNDDPVSNGEICWKGSCYTGSMMRTLYYIYYSTPGWWNNYTIGIMTPKDFLILILFFELKDAVGDAVAVEALKTAAAEKFKWVCAQFSGGNCSGVSDNAIFNYIATRGSAWKRYDKYITNNEKLEPYHDRPNPKDDPFSNPAYQSVVEIVDYVYDNAVGPGSLWDWGNTEMYKSGIAGASVCACLDADKVYYANGDKNFFVLGPVQSNHWIK
jgi:RHS repeat-associated protein